MMPTHYKIYQVDAFTSELFKGNPAAVVFLDTWLADHLMLQIAQENALAETAFLIKGDQDYHIRWFTPEIEMDLCGHATLAAAHCVFEHEDWPSAELVFQSVSGVLTIRKSAAMYTLDFPSRPPVPATLPDNIFRALSIKPKEVYKSRDYVLVYESEQDILDIQVDQRTLDEINIDPGGVAVTAAGDSCDFVSRFFTPQASILEDPVTGSAHCSLTPFWADRLGKSKMLAQQLSNRGGVLHVELRTDSVWISGQAKTFMEGRIHLV